MYSMGKFHTLYLETTRNCNLDCKYCSTGSSCKKKFDDIPYDKVVRRILEPAWTIGTRNISFSGGEFLLREDHIDLLKTASEMGFSVSIVSNGILLTDSKIQELKSILGDNLYVSLGINSFDLENKETREVGSGFIMDVVNRLQKHGVRLNICVTIGYFNKESFKNTVETLQRLHLPFNRIPFVVRNCNASQLMLDKEMLRECFHPYLTDCYNGHVSFVPYFLNPNDYELITGHQLQEDGFATNPSVGCWVGSYYAINPEGYVSPCPLFADSVVAGNVLDENLEDILFKSELFCKITDRKNLEGNCGKCKYTSTCGGCRVMAYYKTGNPFAEDPTCFIEELSDDEQTDLEKRTAHNFKNYNRMLRSSKG